MRHGVIAALLLVSSSACVPAHPLDDEVAAFASAFVRLRCEREIRCIGQTHETQRGRCHPAVGGFFPGAAGDLVAHHDMTFDPEAAGRCLDAVRGLPCSGEFPVLCADVFTPVRSTGDTCLVTSGLHGCVEGSFCAGVPGCEGVCARGAEPGESCELRPCAASGCGLRPPALCSGGPVLGEPCTSHCAEGDLACVAGTCAAVPVANAGEACAPFVAACAEGATCVRGACTSDYSASVGDPCVGIRTCRRELWCNAGACAERLPEGAPCTSSASCAAPADQCVDGSCTSVSDERPRPPSCAGWGGSFVPVARPCPEGLTCDVALFMCLPVVAEGEPCGSAARATCTEGHRCVERVCRTIAAPGAVCGGDVTCPPSFVCEGGSCRPLPVLGEPCAGPCFEAECRAGTCGRRGEGETCAFAADCDSWHCLPDRRCGPALVEGAPCGLTSGACPPGLVCATTADDDGHCVRLDCGT